MKNTSDPSVHRAHEQQLVEHVVKLLDDPRLRLDTVNSNRAVIGFNLIWLWNRAADLAREYDEVRQVITAPPLVGCTFPFADAPAALRFLQSGRSTGKVVLEIRR